MSRIVLRSALVALALFAGAADAQAPAAGTLLVADPGIGDANFAETVLLLIHHGEDGSLGIFVNRPTNLEPERLFPDAPRIASYDGALFLGGPIAPKQPLLLLRGAPPPGIEGPPVLDGVYLSADPSVLETLPEEHIDATSARIYAGHAAWGPGQLEAEIAAGDWTVIAGNADTVFTDAPLEIWRQLARETPGLVVGLQHP